MKTFLFALALAVFSPGFSVAAQTNGFLVFEVSRVNWHAPATEVKQRFEVPLSKEFLAQFKHLPSQNSMGTGFYCAGGNPSSATGGTSFCWWIRRTMDNRWAINMWGEGVENINGTSISARDPKASQYVTIKQMEDLDMTFMLSYISKSDGMNVSFSAKYVPVKEVDAQDATSKIPVERASESGEFKGDDSSNFHMEFHCGFQEG